jgi:hypothetical protein
MHCIWNLEGLVTNAAQVARPMRAYHRLVVHPMGPGEDQVDFYKLSRTHRHNTLRALRVWGCLSCATQVQTLLTSTTVRTFDFITQAFAWRMHRSRDNIEHRR